MPPQAPESGDDLRPVFRAVLIADVVDSVRLIEQDQHGAVRRWQQMLNFVIGEVMPAHGGRLVKSLGDGFMLEFVQPRQAIAAAFAIQHAFTDLNAALPPEQRMLLRMGADCGEIMVGNIDVFGTHVNIAARLLTLAGPGEIVVSEDFRDQITDELDAGVDDLGEHAPLQVRDVLRAEVEYLGDCILKNLADPVRAYRLGPPGPAPVIEPGSSVHGSLRPTIAVIPFSARSGTDEQHKVLGEVLADDVIAALSRTDELHVISRLSTTAFRNRDSTLADIGRHLKVQYTLSGAYRVSDTRVTLMVELAEVASGRVIWTDNRRCQVDEILHGDDELVERMVKGVSSEILKRELERAQVQPLQTLQNYSLLMNAIALMHRGGAAFDRAEEALNLLTTRSRHQATPYAWFAKWYVLRYNRTPDDRDPKREAQLALDCTKRALDAEPNCPLALTMEGFIYTNLLRHLDTGEERYDAALDVNPNESLAWLLKGTLHAFRGEGRVAIDGTEHALKLSPLDPLRYFYESLAATAAHSAGDYERAIELARRSLRANRMHPSTLRALVIAQWKFGLEADAKRTMAELLRLQPHATVRRYLETNPSGGFKTGEEWAEILRQAGMPE